MERRNVLKKFEEQRAATKERVARDIEKYRKGEARLTVCDAAGVPMDAQIKVIQQTHEFKHGANIFMLDDLGDAAKNRAYRDYFKDAFNMATLPFYWCSIEPQRGVTRYANDSTYYYRRPPIEACMEYCAEHGIEPREHALAYENHFPEWLYGADSATVKRELERRYAEISALYADRIPCIEVTNEHEWGADGRRTEFYRDPDFVQWCYQMAERYFPKNEITINEWGGLWSEVNKTRSRYYLLIENALLKGCRIDAIGMQFHMFHRAEHEYDCTRPYYDPANLFDTMDTYARFGKPLQITEVTIPAYSWGAEDEQLQAEIIDQLYRIWFSHPAMEQIIYWNLVDGYAWQAEQGDMTAGENYYHGGLLRFDLTPKPAYETIQNLFHKEWHTETTMSTHEGAAALRGFYGSYEAQITVGSQTVKRHFDLKKQAENDIILTI